jgi:membrane protease YdiL (CAAX protease family)
METNKIEIKTLLISLGMIMGVEFVARVVISKGPYHPMIALGVVRLVETGLIFLVFSVCGNGISSLGLSPRAMGPGLKRGFIWSAGFGAITALVFVVLFLAGIDPLALVRVKLPLSPDQTVVYFLVGGTVGPIAEEILFRGVLYGFLRRWGVIVAVTLSTLIFVLAHPSALHGIPLTQAVGGILLALAYEKEGNLMAPITIHVLGNIAIFALSLIF